MNSVLILSLLPQMQYAIPMLCRHTLTLDHVLKPSNHPGVSVKVGML
jgi:hypothetical protein